ncbi:TIGR03083 family protein [Nocardioides alpinus]|uniref:Maleylpyruvate isomerase family mycothiol-dependent enzyme n=1 Tax=Nocardioides alpinus TaxID=748909 RepID=A0A1I1BEB0_9ACTN|nr:maleylpyruvate isomerase family mycothiol-dependent enzyme [Nocardioides alpinus]PKH40493.1 maleylpyruvate isomerase family mycothiol-dependent enzyme [Nocardioides alpinus]SFB47078.1 TIGR03083 family protein [Nocardioides alpinus]
MEASSPLPDLVRQERRAFIDRLQSLTPQQWEARSLCSEWRVIDVAAHLAWAPTLGPLEGGRAMLRSRLSVNRMIASSAVRWSDRGRVAITEQLEHNLESGAKPIGMPTVAALADAVVHGIDVRHPLGLVQPLSAEVLGPVADFVLRTPWPLNGVVGGSAARRVDGVRLAASDVDWSHGVGPEARASAEAIARLLYGRPLAADELTGPGADVVRARL